MASPFSLTGLKSHSIQGGMGLLSEGCSDREKTDWEKLAILQEIRGRNHVTKRRWLEPFSLRIIPGLLIHFILVANQRLGENHLGGHHYVILSHCGLFESIQNSHKSNLPTELSRDSHRVVIETNKLQLIISVQIFYVSLSISTGQS